MLLLLPVRLFRKGASRLPNKTIKFSSEVAYRLNKGYGANNQPVYFDSNGLATAITAANLASFVDGQHKWVRIAGDTMTGTLSIRNNGESIVIVSDGVHYTDNTFRLLMTLNGSTGIQGIWSSGYSDGTTFTSSSKWLIQRDTTGNVKFYGNADTATKLASTPNNTTTFLRGDNTWSSTLSGTTWKITNNNNTVTIGSQNASFTHIYNSADIPFIFNKSVLTTAGNLGNSDYPWNNIYIGRANGAGIYYKGTQAVFRMIRFIDNTADTYGNGISIGGGGLAVFGSGESADTILSNLSLTAAGGTETTYIGSDGEINFYPQINTWDAAGRIYMQAGRLWVGVNGNTTRENQIGVQSGSGQIYMFSGASTTGNRGIYVTAHGSGSARAVITVGTNNEVYFADGYNGTATRLAYSQAGLAASAITWLACWNGYELRAINKSQFALAGHTHTNIVLGASNTAFTNTSTVALNGINVRWYSTASTFSGQPSQWGFLITVAAGDSSTENHQFFVEQSNGGVFHRGTNSSTAASPPAFRRLWSAGDAVTSAVWNDYAEFRSASGMPGQVVYELGDDTLLPTTQRLQHFAGIISDTWGFSQGKTESANTPIAVAGRVLAYPYQNRNNYQPGDCVCAAPGGTVDIMTREEIIEYPDRIIGTVSCVPVYEEWGGGENADRDPIKVNGRIWIHIK